MRNKLLFLVAAAFAAMTLPSCDPANPGDDDEGAGDGDKTGKVIAKITVPGEGGGELIPTYDEQGRVVGLNIFDLAFAYHSDKVVITATGESSTDGGGVQPFDYSATAALTGGKITSVTEDDDGPDEVYGFTYNGDRLATHFDERDTYTATWTGDNVTKVVSSASNPVPGIYQTVYTEVFEYTSYANDANIDLNTCLLSMSELWGDNDIFLTWTNLMGARCKNLVSKITTTAKPHEQEPQMYTVFEYAYTVDKDGRVTKIVSTHKHYRPDGTLIADETDTGTIEITYK